jgi:hypothetical protein
MPIPDASQFVQFKKQAANMITFKSDKKHSGITFNPVPAQTSVGIDTFLSTVTGKDKTGLPPTVRRDYAPRPAKYAKVGGFGC